MTGNLVGSSNVFLLVHQLVGLHFMVYGCDAHIPSSVSFTPPVTEYHTLHTEYGKS